MSLSRNAKLKLSYSSIIAGIFVAIIAGIYEQDVNLARMASEKFYANLNETYASEPAEEEPTAPDWYGKVDINLAELQKVNPDVVGWIFFENEPISYPILYSGDNETYLRHTYTKEYAIAGSIFIDYHNKPDFSDPRTMIHGHNLEDDSTMFSRIVHFLDDNYYEEHRFFQIIANNKAYRYEIYNAEIVEPDDNIYSSVASDRGESDKHLILLSTCYDHSAKRVIVTAKRVDEYNF